jgi:hypothetical protein
MNIEQLRCCTQNSLKEIVKALVRGRMYSKICGEAMPLTLHVNEDVVPERAALIAQYHTSFSSQQWLRDREDHLSLE